ncbi:MAG: undecaprenyl-diphosphate phosphatase [Verrucomicrobiia bacterium]
MDWLQALILGVVEGVTEYLPISSTGHLLVVQRLLGIEQSDAADAFAICIQAGAILAVLTLFWRRILAMARGCLGRDPDGLRLGMNIGVAFLPAVVLGLLLEKLIKRYLFGGQDWGLWPIIGAWIVGGLAILTVAFWLRKRRLTGGKRLELLSLTWRMALIIGVAQCLAMWPGTSRSLVTIVAGVLVGLRLGAAVEFSFLLGVLTLTAATAKEALGHGATMFENFGFMPLAVGFLSAWLSAWIAVKWMISYLNAHGLELFGYYRIAIGIIAAIAVWRGVL